MPVIVEEDNNGKTILTNEAFIFSFSQKNGRFTIHRKGAETPVILNATVEAVCKAGGRTIITRMDQAGRITTQMAPGRDAHGTGHHALFYWSGENNMRLGLHVVLYDSLPFMLMRATLIHRLDGTVTVSSLSPLVADPQETGGLRFNVMPINLRFFQNGWSSWSPSGHMPINQPTLDSQLTKHARGALINPHTPLGGKTELWSESFTVIGPAGGASGERDRTGLVAGFVSLADQFAAIGADFPTPATETAEKPLSLFAMICQGDNLALPQDNSLASEWAFLQWVNLDTPDLFADYIDAAARHVGAQAPARGPIGWVSAPNAHEKVSEAQVRTAISAIEGLRATLPIDLIEVDAGYADIPGDWTQSNTTRFPNKLETLAQHIVTRHMTPGIWLAPCVVHADSLIAADHQEWLVKESNGRPVPVGVYNDGLLYALDATHPEVLSWLDALIRRVRREWGFPYIRLDYLYAGAIPGKRRDASMTGAQALHRALLTIREAAGPDTFLHAAGSPLGPALGPVNAMRIGPDSAPTWVARTGPWAQVIKPGPASPGARNAIRNTIARSMLHRRWWLNDPDFVTLRDVAEGMTGAEVRSLLTVVGLSGGLLSIGDDPSRLDPQQIAQAAVLRPEIPERAFAPDLLEQEYPERFVLRIARPWGEWCVAGVFNWSDEPRDLTVRAVDLRLDRARPLHAYDFWNRRYHRLIGQELFLPHVPAHGCHVFGFRAISETPHLVGSTFHISQGGELSAWSADAQQVRFTITLERQAEGDILFWTPTPPRGATCGGQALALTDVGGGVWSIHFTVNHSAQVEIALS